MKKSDHVTPGEFELLKILWSLGEASVKDVRQKVDPDRGLAYTTVMTVLEKLHRKGILTRRKMGKAFLYSPAVNQDQVLKGILEHIRTAYFGGSHADLAVFVGQNYPIQVPETPKSQQDN